MTEKFYVTTPIYYVNDVPHIGHAYTTIAADALARYRRLCGEAVFFLTGTDEHGQKVEQAATEQGRSPQKHADIMARNFELLWNKLEISNDAFIRTTDREHTTVVRELLQTLYDKGEIERRTYEGWYCTPDERFWTAKELVEGNCPECGRPVERIAEDNYFFLMGKYRDRLIEHIENNPTYVLPESRRNEVLGFLKSQPLGDLCISRPKSRLRWGVELPFDTDFVTYVWFDALINYISGTRYLSPTPDGVAAPLERERFWWPADHHLVGQDILTTHSVYWSTMLMALEVPLPGTIFAHGWWTREGRKMSKSLGNVIDPNEVVDAYGADAFRYFLLREVPFGLDGDFSLEAFVTRFNTELANDLGNLLSRVQTMISKYFSGRVPQAGPEEAFDKDLRATAEAMPEKIGADLSELAFNKYLLDLWTLVSRANRYVEENVPWTLAKKKDRERLGSVLYNLAESLRLIGLFIYPVMPSTAQKIWSGLGMKKTIAHSRLDQERSWGRLPAGTAITTGVHLFPRIEWNVQTGRESLQRNAEKIKRRGAEKNVDAEQETKKAESKPESKAGLVDMKDFAKVDLRVGKVITAERVEKSEKLLKLQVDIGSETRQVVAGIGKHYAPEELTGKTVALVVNLKPAKLMGIESQGMLLAAGNDDTFAVATFDRQMPPGSKIK